MKSPSLLSFLAPLALILLPINVPAADFDQQLHNIQAAWAVANYELPDKQKEKAFKKLVADAEHLTSANPTRPEPKIWEAISRSGHAGAMGGVKPMFKAMPQVKHAKALLLEAEKIDANALNGSALTSLGSLHYLVPGWPIGFGNKDKAGRYLKKALAAAPRPNRPVADAGRMREIKARLGSLRMHAPPWQSLYACSSRCARRPGPLEVKPPKMAGDIQQLANHIQTWAGFALHGFG